MKNDAAALLNSWKCWSIPSTSEPQILHSVCISEDVSVTTDALSGDSSKEFENKIASRSSPNFWAVVILPPEIF